MKISKELARKAKKHDICQEWHQELKSLDDKREMVKMYLRGIDFCLENNFPENDYIKKNFKDVINEFGIYVDGDIDLRNAKKCVALGSSKGRFYVDGYDVAEVFVKHDSVVNVIAKDNSFVMIDVFDDSVVLVYAQGDAKVCVNRYGNAIVRPCEIESARIKIVEKNKKNY